MPEYVSEGLGLYLRLEHEAIFESFESGRALGARVRCPRTIRNHDLPSTRPDRLRWS